MATRSGFGIEAETVIKICSSLQSELDSKSYVYKWKDSRYHESKDGQKSIVIGLCIVNLYWCKKCVH